MFGYGLGLGVLLGATLGAFLVRYGIAYGVKTVWQVRQDMPPPGAEYALPVLQSNTDGTEDEDLEID